MAYRVTLDLPDDPDPQVLVDLANVHAAATADWYLRQWGDGYDPPPSAALAGCRFAPIRSRSDLTFRSAREVFMSGRGDCWEFAAIYVGHLRASARRDGMNYDYADKQFRVELEPGIDPAGATDEYWHAVALVRGRYIDPTKG